MKKLIISEKKEKKISEPDTENSEDEEIGLDYIIKAKPAPSTVREFLRTQICSITDEDEDEIMNA